MRAYACIVYPVHFEFVDFEKEGGDFVSNIEPSNNSSVPLSSRKANFSWNVFKNSFLLPIFSIGLLAGSGYLFYTGEPEAGAALSGSAMKLQLIYRRDLAVLRLYKYLNAHL
ncbi:hypothetical protein H6G81_15005 [Scytonema hofmannii FACHB-248]|uniref:Uncharacterized protein n=1 Tax=Scytonema hofmannii FACHB-248 TaxID=1842502 RepID=A0ABR8GQR7_9CYAN|nr:hypothetical protein [Scytonema hofmannii]MBD2605790.1 hypothetical protein [Scytonema hofmannii FACHB-248]